ncbi:single-stranded DNA-binding protein [Agrococcus jejuensis]|uniref:Single-stranded DNA-binding protein n=1 Tax=Agrococcus jejuensis TaxID=399736 RepID=A0A1G8GPC0_9MICO|nr:single-stranded DNA-binding protein [Agrococcus jejuensis]SDH96176.1 single-strand DNA-binding protein [Agrococcus jejuensis]
MTDRITIEGTAGSTPQLRTIPSGRQVANLRVASTLRKQDPSTGQWSDAGTNWYSIAVWGDLAAHVAQSIRQGDPVLVTGRLRITTWGDDDRPATTVEIEADAIGHSLRWGTTAFQRASRAASESASVAAPAAAAAPAVDAQGWATPGAAASATDVEPAALQPVLAGVDDDVPF